MAKSKLSQVLEWIEQSPGGMSLPALAHELDISRGQIDNLVEYWVRKGRLRIAADQPDCGSCGEQNGCPFILEMPRYYEVVQD